MLCDLKLRLVLNEVGGRANLGIDFAVFLLLPILGELLKREDAKVLPGPYAMGLHLRHLLRCLGRYYLTTPKAVTRSMSSLLVVIGVVCSALSHIDL